jgi:septal ring factor EnvC (AmiA/AmiB activator)
MKFLQLGCLALLIAIPTVLVAQGEQFPDTLEANKRLRELRQQIRQLESRIASTDARETNLLTELDDLDHNISLRQSLITTLGQERDRLNTSIQRTTRHIHYRQDEIRRLVRDRNDLQHQHQELKTTVNRRTAHVYKHWNLDRWTVLLDAKSLPDMLSRQFYFRKLHHWDIKQLTQLSRSADSLRIIEHRIRTEQEELNLDLSRLESAQQHKTELIEQTRKQETALVNTRGDRTAVLMQVRADRQSLQERLEETRQAAQQVENTIAALEARRVPTEPPPGYFTSGKPFAALVGKIPWPVPGKVITRFGQYRHPQLGTITENTGIDIETPRGTPVRAVSDARVGMVTWLRGFGSTIILDHRDGHYTVYAHLEEVLVAQDDWLRAGEIIGTVGDTGSLQGPRLHFEIWHKHQIQDPQLWLSKSPLP